VLVKTTRECEVAGDARVMLDALLFVLVAGAVLLALAVDVMMMLSWLRRRPLCRLYQFVAAFERFADSLRQ